MTMVHKLSTAALCHCVHLLENCLAIKAWTQDNCTILGKVLLHVDSRDTQFDRMSGSSKEALKLRLLKLKCHFTWKLLLKVIDPDEIEERLYEQLTFLVTKNKYMVYNLLAYVMHLKGDYTKAIENLEKAEEMIKENNLDGTDHRYLVTYGNYAWVFYYLNQYEVSQKYIEKVKKISKELKDKPDIPEIFGEKAWSLLTFGRQYYEEAKQCFEKALELEPEDPEWNSGYATVVYRLEGFNGRKCPDSECKILELLKCAVEKNPNDAVVKALLALKLQDLKRNDEGKTYIKEAIEQAPNLPYVLRYVAKFYRRAGMLDEALRVLKTSIEFIPTSEFLHHQIGLCYRIKYFNYKKESGNSNINNREMDRESNVLIQNAIFHFKKALEYKKTFVHAYIDLAISYCKIKEYRKAEDSLQAVLAFTNLSDEDKQQIYFSYGHLKERYMRSESDAIHYYKQCLQINLFQKEREGSEKALKRISLMKIKRNSHDAEGFALLGFVHKTNGEREDAIDCYEKALKCDPYNEEYVSELCELKSMI
ncbi:interferon-induced protein with tetratricopeptide repeats 5-like isoform X2 [Hyla sarda]|uniref:interferon-induced protein with tetratricopeptide repeats 5-like isoform X2 n=1 Tax=Hyla sarda TaxID=327740 RepID=UPI0024C302EA|nr:interferon-induced protein with tetratricopeptide repeats 5-like isoform X2 [Hyla sarda]